MITAVLSGISIASIIIVTTVLMLKQNELSDDYNQKIKRVVSQVNEVNATGYNVLQNQESELGATNKNLENVRATYVTSEGLANRVATTSTNIGKDYEINKDPKNNNLNINLPQGKQSGFSLISGEQTKFAVDGETGKVSVKNDVNVTGNLKGNKLQLGDKFLLSGVGDAHGNDGWLRFFDKDGKDYYGGVATANLWSRDNSYLNGTTNVNGPLVLNGNRSIQNAGGDGWWNGITQNNDLVINNTTTDLGGKQVNGNGITLAPWNGVGGLRAHGAGVDINGTLRANGDISTPNGNVIHSDGRQHISAGEQLYLLPKDGVQIGKEWGGNGSLNVQGNLSTGGDTNINGKFTVAKGDGDWNWAHVVGNHGDSVYLGSDGGNRGIWADGNRNFSVYNQGQTGLTVDTAGNAYAAGNQIKMSTNWTGYPDNSQNSEIANDTNAFKSLMIVGNKSGGGERRVGVWDTLNVNGTLNANGPANINGTLRANGDISTPNGNTMHSDGRQHISAGEILYLLPKNGVQIGKEWGGTGNLNVQGTITTPTGIEVTNNDPGPLVEKRYNWADGGDRYGVGQFGNGQMKMYTATNYPGNVSMSLAKKNGQFDDIVTVNSDRSVNINGPLVVNHADNDASHMGINLWHHDDRRFGMWMGETGENGGKSLTGGPVAHGDIGHHSVRFSTGNWDGHGFVFQNSDGRPLMSIKGDDARTNIYGPLNINDGNNDGSQRGLNLWHQNDRRFGMWMSDTAPNGGKSLTGGPVADGDIARHSVRFSTGNWDGHGFVFQNSDGKSLMSIKGDDARTNVYGPLNVNGTLRAKADISTPNGNVIHSDGRQHISAGEILYLLPNNGVSIGKEWGGTGDLRVQGNTEINGNLNVGAAININNNRSINKAQGNGWWNYITKADDMVIFNATKDLGGKAVDANGITIAPWNGVGGLRVHGAGVNVGGELNAPTVNISGKWRFGDTGDDWLRVNAPGRSDGGGYYGGVAAGRLWTAQGGLAGSDSRMKNNVVDINKTNTDNLLKLNPKAYTYKDDKEQRQRFGFIAQDVEKVYPNMVSEGANGMKSLNYDDIIPLTVANIKDIRKNIPDNKSLCIDGICLNKNDLINLKKLSSM